LIAESMKNEHLLRELTMRQSGDAGEDKLAELKRQLDEKIQRLDAELEFIKSINTAQEYMQDETIDRLRKIGRKTFKWQGEERTYLTADELDNLSIRKGTLNAEERKIIENHATVTLKILNELPFPKNLSMVPEYAAGHHEKLDGSGYPRHLSKQKLPLQSRIMAIADIFEALTARDRPYKKPMKLSQALNILSFMTKDGHIDPDIYQLVLNSSLFFDYAANNMSPDQIDKMERNQ